MRVSSPSRMWRSSQRLEPPKLDQKGTISQSRGRSFVFNPNAFAIPRIELRIDKDRLISSVGGFRGADSSTKIRTLISSSMGGNYHC